VTATGDDGTEGVYETEQAPEERAHDVDEKLPVALAVHVIVPVGAAPVMAAVHSEASVTATGEGVQVTEIVSTLGAKANASSAQPSLVV